MCTICGCGTESLGGHHHAHGHFHTHSHGHTHHDHLHEAPGLIDAGAGEAGVHVAGLSQQRILRIERDVLATNNGYARQNRLTLARTGSFALNFVSSPGSGKTTLLCRAIEDLKFRFPVVVIEGDQQTSNDADRIRRTGAEAIQVNTGKGCHLDAHMVGHALERLELARGGLVFIENVGNLVCPAGFDLGEAHKVVVLSVTEGEDKPEKYPDMFAASDLMLLTKCDLLPHLEFDLQAAIRSALKVNPHLRILQVSARTGAGMAAFYDWIETQSPAARQPAIVET